MFSSIENDMARLMERPVYSVSKMSEPAYPPVVGKVMTILDRFVEKYGSVHLEVFRLLTSSPSELQRYLNALSTILKRQGIIVSCT